MTAATNHLQLRAQIAQRKPLRYTPAGLPVFEGQLSHQSGQIQAGQPRQVSLALAAQAVGTLAEQLGTLALGQAARFEGFLAQPSNARNVVFHIQSFAPILES